MRRKRESSARRGGCFGRPETRAHILRSAEAAASAAGSKRKKTTRKKELRGTWNKALKATQGGSIALSQGNGRSCHRACGTIVSIRWTETLRGHTFWRHCLRQPTSTDSFNFSEDVTLGRVRELSRQGCTLHMSSMFISVMFFGVLACTQAKSRKRLRRSSNSSLGQVLARQCDCEQLGRSDARSKLHF